MRQIVIVVSTVIMLSGCAGNGIMPNASSFFATASMSTIAEPMRMADAVAQFTLHWPRERKRIITQRGAFWISPSTASIVIEVNDDAKNATIVNAPKITGKAATSVVKIQAPIGRDSFSLMLYDQKQKVSGKFPIGNLVGDATVVQAIVAGKTNKVNATVVGVMAQVDIRAAPDQPCVSVDSKTGGLDFVGDGPEALIATAEDADGDTIVPQPQGLTVKPSVSSASYLRVRQPDPKSQVFVVSPITNVPSGSALVLVAKGVDGAGDTVQTATQITEVSAIYVAYAQAPSGASPIVVYNAGTDAVVPLPSSAFGGLGSVSALVYDLHDHRLLVGDAANGTVDAYDPAGTVAPGFTAIHVGGVNAIAYNYSNQEIFVDGTLGVTAYTRGGGQVGLPASAFSQTGSPGPLAAIVSSGDVAVGSTSLGSIDIYTPAGTYVETTSVSATSVRGLSPNFIDINGIVLADVFAVGPGTSGGVDLFDAIAGNPNASALSTLADPLALAADLNSPSLYIASGTANAIIPMVYVYPSWTLRAPIPSASGYSNPIAVAIGY